MRFQFSIRTLALILTASVIALSVYSYLNRPEEVKTVIRTDINATADLPRACSYIFLDKERRPLGALVFFGEYPKEIIAFCNSLRINSKSVRSPIDGHVHVISPTLESVKCDVDLDLLARYSHDHSQWSGLTPQFVRKHKWKAGDSNP